MFDNLNQYLAQIVLLAPAFLMAITVHEFAHGYIAWKFGDPTAKNAGRLTFNPISHLDPFGTAALLLTGLIGWAKPVPVDPRYLRTPRSDMLWISLGGPAANLLTAMALAVVMHVVVSFFVGSQRQDLIEFIRSAPGGFLLYGIRINVALAIFNMIPLPPLDGAAVLSGLLPRHLAHQYEKVEPYGVFILLGLLLTGAVGYVLGPAIQFVVGLLLRGL